MPDIEKTIQGLECCKMDRMHRVNCKDCPYYTDDEEGQIWCDNRVKSDAIELLKKLDALTFEKRWEKRVK